MKLYATLNDGIKEATVSFAPEKLDALRQKHGPNLRLLTAYVPKPAAIGTATLTPFAERPTAKTPTKRVLAPIAPVVAPAPVVPAARVQKLKAATPKRNGKASPKPKPAQAKAKKRAGYKGRAVVCITTGRYFISASQAARAIDCNLGNLYEQLRGKGRRNCTRRTVKGRAFRYATPDEVAAGRVLDAQPVA